MQDKEFPLMREVVQLEGKRLCKVTYKFGTNAVWRLQWKAGLLVWPKKLPQDYNKQVRKCTRSVTVLGVSTEFDLCDWTENFLSGNSLPSNLHMHKRL